MQQTSMYKWALVWAVAHREWSEAVSSPLFWLGALGLPLILFVLLPIGLFLFLGSQVKDESGALDVVPPTESDVSSIVTHLSQQDTLVVESSLPTLQNNTRSTHNETEFDSDIYSYFMFVVIFFIFLQSIIVSLILLSVIQEKSSKLIEVLLASVKPLHLMDGKVLGALLITFTVMGTWVATGLVGSLINLAITAKMDPSSTFSLLQFIVDYLLLSVPLWNCLLFFALGTPCIGYVVSSVAAVCRTNVEARIMSMPFTALMASPFIFLIIDIGNPPPWSYAFVPLCTSFTMMLLSEHLPAFPWYLLIVLWLILYTLGIRWIADRTYSKYILSEDNVSGFKKLVGLSPSASKKM